MQPFGIISDTHHNNWSAFASVDAHGVNSRLAATLAETRRAAQAVKAAGGDCLYHGGDLFHVRGSIAPSVLNPTLDCYREILASGLKVVINAGNHDLEGRTAQRVSSAITAFEGIGCIVVNEPMCVGDMAIVPWIANLPDLKAAVEGWADAPNLDLLIHAPVDGVIAGLPDSGLEPSYLASLGFRRVFAGHYHHHKEVADNVWSIGALTHQSWSDVHAKAGFLIVDDGAVHWHASRAPAFVEVDSATDPADVPLIVDGNYVRVRIGSGKPSDIEAVRQHMLDSGAAGVTVLQLPGAPLHARAGGAIKAGLSLEASIAEYIGANGYAEPAAVTALCLDILTSVRSVA